MSERSRSSDIVSLDLLRSARSSVDVTRNFPFSDVHAISSQADELDTMRAGRGGDIDLGVRQSLRVERAYDIETVDIVYKEERARRGLTRYDSIGQDPYTIDLFPPLPDVLGALDVRGGEIISRRKYSDIYTRSLPIRIHMKRWSKHLRELIRAYRQPAIGILLIVIGCSLPILLYVEKVTRGAYAELANLRNVSDIVSIDSTLREARGDFERANILFFPYRWLPFEKIGLARSAIDGGLALSRGMSRIISTIDTSSSGSLLSKEREVGDSLYRPTPTDIRPLAVLGVEHPTDWIRQHREDIIALRRELSRASIAYEDASGLADTRADEVAHIGRALRKISGIIDFALTHETDIMRLLGADNPERYIVFNQNRDEIRANGGFPGSIITFTMYKGNISDYRTDDVYYYDWNLYPYRESPPPGLALISGNYGLRDVNYYPDFRDTLEKANSFIERSGDPTITIGLALHQGLIEDILRDIGGVKLDGIDERLTSENFSLLMSLLVESRYGEVTSAKDILGEFVGAFIRKIHDERAYEEVITRIEDSMKNGEILFASRNKEIDTFLSLWKKPLPWERELLKNSGTGTLVGSEPKDTLFETLKDMSGINAREKNAIEWSHPVLSENWAYPVLTSLSGNKSDRLIERSYRASSERVGACSVENTLILSHKHLYTRSYEDRILLFQKLIGITDPTLRDKLLDIQGRGKNKTYIRLLVPIDAKLSGSPAGIDETATLDYREFAFSLDTPIGGSSSKTIRYTTTLDNCRTLPKLDWYRQPGLARTTFESR